MSNEILKSKDNKQLNEDKNYETIKTFTKTWTNRLLWFSCVWITLSYVLAFMDKTQVATDLSIQIVTIVIGTYIPYVTRGFLDTFSMKRQEYKNKLLEMNNQESRDNDGMAN